MTQPITSALVLGIGLSGAAAGRLLLGEGTRVTLVDAAAGPAVSARAAALRALGARALTGVTDLPDAPYDRVVVSPGLPREHPWIATAAARGWRIVGELELAASRLACPAVAITGTNGKSTLTALCADTLRRAGARVVVGGNTDTALSDLTAASRAADWAVIEVSSFQLEWVETFQPRIGVLLNVQPDHLDRYRDMRDYASVKARLFARMHGADTAMIEAGAAAAWSLPVPACRVWRLGGPGGELAYRSGMIDVAGRRLSVTGTRFDHPALGLAAAAAGGVAVAAGADLDCLAAALREFRPLRHRLETVATIGGVHYIDDSKATNLAAMRVALESAGRPVRLIAGGLPKGDDPAALKETLAKTVRKVYGIGDAAEAFCRAWSEAAPCAVFGTLDRAVAAAAHDAEPGECVLLSPGCASFDQYAGYAERGEHFVRLVNDTRKEGS